MLTQSSDRREAMTEESAAEPSLEDILASIRRIIAEEGPAAATATLRSEPRHAELAMAEDVLLLTRRVPEPQNDLPHADEEPPEPEPPASAVEALMDPTQAPVLEAAPAVAEPEPTPSPPVQEEPAVAPETHAAAAEAFDRLSAAAQGQASEHALALPAPGRTLEDLVRELMRPMIKTWLDENLPAMVQARVDDEIEKIARRRVT
jgi:cell pole-organizing protein PopZ